MTMKKTEGMPLLVHVGLLGIGSRSAAFGFFWACIVLIAISAAYGFADHRWFGGVIGFGLAAGWYLYAIRWVDKHSSWNA
jgi:hypothetical protein